MIGEKFQQKWITSLTYSLKLIQFKEVIKGIIVKDFYKNVNIFLKIKKQKSLITEDLTISENESEFENVSESENENENNSE